MRFRTKWFTGQSLQTKYLLIVILAMLAPMLVIGFCLYHLVFTLLAIQMAFPEAIMANLVPVIQKVNMILAISLPILTLLILWLAMMISHRFAGPIERLERELDQALAGDYNHQLTLREKDDLRGVVDRINVLLGRLKK